MKAEQPIFRDGEWWVQFTKEGSESLFTTFRDLEPILKELKPLDRGFQYEVHFSGWITFREEEHALWAWMKWA